MTRMKQAMRWFGPSDSVSLNTLRQSGCTDVVTALHHVPVGHVWTETEIKTRQDTVARSGLTWSVVESLPVHEDIKKRSGSWRENIDSYLTSLQNLAACGIEVVTYNFMPVLDWVRTDIAFRLDDGTEALRFQKLWFAAFDIHLLNRPGARHDYTPEEATSATALFDKLTVAERNTLSKTVLLGLPGATTAFDSQQLLESVASYKHIDEDGLRSNLSDFLKVISPVAQELGIRLAIHPDDPPFSVLGLPRIVSTQADFRQIFGSSAEIANGLCFCTGSLGARLDNDIVSILEEFGDRVHFLHLRNTLVEPNGDFSEANHLEGSTDMPQVVASIIRLMNRRGVSLPMRPDHGHRMLDDLARESYPGYSAIGRMKALAELRGLEVGLRYGRQNV